MSKQAPPEFDTCLGDLYSVSWLENSEQADLSDETLKQQYKAVRFRTSHNGTFQQGSHAMKYGDPAMNSELAGDYLGMENKGALYTCQQLASSLMYRSRVQNSIQFNSIVYIYHFGRSPQPHAIRQPLK